MKFIKGAFIFLLLSFIGAVIGYLRYKQNHKPIYEGTLKLSSLSDKVNVIYDQRGVPNIYAQNERDMYQALGYVHAQDRLFQFELILRAANGTLAEIFGPKALPVDKKIRALGFKAHGKTSIDYYKSLNHPALAAMEAYVEGVNDFVKNGITPFEFDVLGIEKRKFTLEDLILCGDYLSFGFTFAVKQDPIFDKMNRILDQEHLQELILGYEKGLQQTPAFYPSINADSLLYAGGSNGSLKKIATLNEDDLAKELAAIGIPIWLGSNGWAVSPKKTAKGQVLFANDTHIGFSQPAVWYEASIHCPGFDYFGQFIAFNPFGPIGYTPHHSWGVTMLLNDDLDFFRETVNEDSTQVMYKGEWVPLEQTVEHFSIKDQGDQTHTYYKTPHGPIMNSVLDGLKLEEKPVSMHWTYLTKPNQMGILPYEMARAKNIQDFESIISRTSGPGFNCLYGDADGNIGWWTMAELIKRPAHVNGKTILDGASGKDEYLGYFPFEMNPKSVNPPSGFVFSSNNQIDTLQEGTFYPGYYYPGYRAQVIHDALNTEKKLTAKDMIELQINGENLEFVRIKKALKGYFRNLAKSGSNDQQFIANAILDFDGNYTLESKEATVYEFFIAQLMQLIFEDELGEVIFEQAKNTHLLTKARPRILESDTSVWWDNILTASEKETREMILDQAVDVTVSVLKKHFDFFESPSLQWGKRHTLTHAHPLSKAPGFMGKLFAKYLNVGPFEMPSSNFSPNKLRGDLDEAGNFDVVSGPSLRYVRDFGEKGFTWKILPTGQSGNPWSEFYKSQAADYAKGIYKEQYIDSADIQLNRHSVLILEP